MTASIPRNSLPSLNSPNCQALCCLHADCSVDSRIPWLPGSTYQFVSVISKDPQCVTGKLWVFVFARQSNLHLTLSTKVSQSLDLEPEVNYSTAWNQSSWLQRGLRSSTTLTLAGWAGQKLSSKCHPPVHPSPTLIRQNLCRYELATVWLIQNILSMKDAGINFKEVRYPWDETWPQKSRTL